MPIVIDVSRPPRNQNEILFTIGVPDAETNTFLITFVIVTHNQELANMADRKLEMKDGKII